MHHKKTSGFSLIEISITLVIAGLIIAAVTSGAHLMQAAKLDKIISEMSGYVTAVNNFKDKYRAWPGDMPNATSFWGTYSAGPPITGTTNGDGNEQVPAGSSESLMFWNQLALSGLISGKYTGVSGVSPTYQPGVNVPGSVVEGAYYRISYWGPTYGTTGTYLQLSATYGANSASGAALTSADTHIIDTKIDDGLAGTGKLYGLRGGDYSGIAGKCVDGDVSDPSANYILTDYSITCRMIYFLNKN